MITFRDVDKDNFQAAISLEVHENQKCFMEDNLSRLLNVPFEKDFRTKVVYSDGEPIGFLLYYFVKDDPDYVFLHRYMIDKDQQGRAWGAQPWRPPWTCSRRIPFHRLRRTDALSRQQNWRRHVRIPGLCPTGENRERTVPLRTRNQKSGPLCRNRQTQVLCSTLSLINRRTVKVKRHHKY